MSGVYRKQTGEDPVARLERLLAVADARLRRRFRAAVQQMKTSVNISTMAEMLGAGRFNEALASLEVHIARFADEVNAIYILAGKDTAKLLEDVLEVLVDFDTINERAVRLMRENKLRLIREFLDSQRAATQHALVGGITEGLNPIAQAKAFRDSIGLTSRQEAAVRNYRRLLQTGDRGALVRALRDRRFDPTVGRALASDTPLTTSQIDRMVARYRERYVKYRSEVIARTESLRTVHQGNEEMYRQAVETGKLDAAELTRTWVTARDERVRSTHSTMGGQRRGFDEPFISGAGRQLRYPGDPSAPPEEIIQCRCAITTRIGKRR